MTGLMNAPLHIYPIPTLRCLHPADESPPFLRKALYEMQAELQVSWDIVFLTMLSAASTVCAPLCDVKSPTGKISPLSIYTLVIADSGTGKSSTARLVSKPLLDFDKACELEFPALLEQCRLALLGWTVIQKALEKKLTDAVKQGASVDEPQRELLLHAQKKPKKPRLHRLIRNKLSISALLEGLEGVRQLVAMMVDEGGILLDSDFVDLIMYITKIWDGDSLIIERAKNASLIINDPRMTLTLMVQSGVLERYLKKHRDFLRDSGFLARLLVAKPARIYREFNNVQRQTPALDKLYARMNRLLDARLNVAGDRHIVLEFGDYAETKWFNYAREFEQFAQPGQYLCDAPDLAAKAMENITRIAALFHFFTKQEGLITVESLERAYYVVWHFIHEWKRIFATSQVVFDAHELELFLHRRYLECGMTQYLHNFFLTSGPVCTRKKKSLDPAINKLVSENKVWITYGRNNTRLVNLNINGNPPIFNGT